MNVALLTLLQILQYLVLCCKVFSFISEQFILMEPSMQQLERTIFQLHCYTFLYKCHFKICMMFQNNTLCYCLLTSFKRGKDSFVTLLGGIFPLASQFPSTSEIKARPVARTAGPSAFCSGTWSSESHTTSLSCLKQNFVLCSTQFVGASAYSLLISKYPFFTDLQVPEMVATRPAKFSAWTSLVLLFK